MRSCNNLALVRNFWRLRRFVPGAGETCGAGVVGVEGKSFGHSTQKNPWFLDQFKEGSFVSRNW